MRSPPVLPSRGGGPLHIRLFGVVELSRGQRRFRFPTRKAHSLLALLILERHKSHCRDELADCFWPEAGRSRAALRTELWRIRRTLADGGLTPDQFLRESQDAVRFSPEAPVTVDTEAFDRAVAAWPATRAAAEDAAALRRGLDLYRADLLEGEYGEWCLYHRESYRRRFIGGLERLMDYAMQVHDWRHAIEVGHRLLNWDPLAEHIYRHLMACYDAMGNRPAALRQYARCVSVLSRELAVQPMEETRARFEEIQRRGTGAPRTAPTAPSQASLRRARDALDEAARQLDNALVDSVTSEPGTLEPRPADPRRSEVSPGPLAGARS